MTSTMPSQTERPTNADALGTPDPTWPPMSANRYAACAWYCAMMRQTATASNDGARFLAGLEG